MRRRAVGPRAIFAVRSALRTSKTTLRRGGANGATHPRAGRNLWITFERSGIHRETEFPSCGASFLQVGSFDVAEIISEVPTMPPLLERNTSPNGGGARAVRILAKTLFRQLRESGYNN